MSRLQEPSFWEQYKSYLMTIMSADTACDRISYARRYHNILLRDNASELLALKHDKRVHAMKSLASLSKFLGCYDKWTRIRMQYQLKWSNGDSLMTFNNIVDAKKNYGNMITWLRDSYSSLPKGYGNILIYCCLTGLRPNESFKSIEFIQRDFDNYLNKDTMMLEHFRYPDIFIRRTKKAYLSILTPKILQVAKESNCSNYNTFKTILRRNKLEMKMSYCRKIFATYLRMNQIESETIDLLQGRIPKSVFARHYFRPDFNTLKIRKELEKLFKLLVQ